MTLSGKRLAVVVVAALVATPLHAADMDLDALFSELQDPATEDWQKVETRILNEFAKSGSRVADLLLERGRDALADEDYKAAVEHFTALTDHAPDFAEGWNGLATTYFRQEEWGLALEALQHALALNPRHFEALTGLGIILEQTGRTDLALRAFRAAEALNPHVDGVADAIARLAPGVDGRDI